MKIRGAGVWVTTIVITMIISVAGATYFFGVGPFASGRTKLVVSTTTSLYDTGLLDVIEEQFEAKYPIDIYFISAGTGLAIEYAKRGDADMILVHSPQQELAFLEGEYGVCRKIVAYNFFAIVGPATDPAKLNGTTVTQALSKIVEAGRKGDARWVSRGDSSGTHTKEKSLWAQAGFDWNELSHESWYVESGTGMGKTLLIADEQVKYDNQIAYTLADIGTYLKYYKDALINLEVLISQDQELLNVYSVISANINHNPEVNFDAVIIFIKYIVSAEGQQIIGDYGKDTYGKSMFLPAVQLLNQNTDPTLVQWIESYAYFNGSECPLEYQDDKQELYN